MRLIALHGVKTISSVSTKFLKFVRKSALAASAISTETAVKPTM